MAEAALWGIHGGRTGDANSLFLEKNVIAVGWAAAGDLSEVSIGRSSTSSASTNALAVSSAADLREVGVVDSAIRRRQTSH